MNFIISYAIKIKDVCEMLGADKIEQLLNKNSMKVDLKDSACGLRWLSRIERIKDKNGILNVETYVAYDERKDSFFLDVYEVV
jgi:hypothetical protein